MSPAHFNDHHHHHALFPPPLKTSRDSRSIKKPSPSSSSSSSSTTAAAAPFLAAAAAAAKPSRQQQQRHPVIIYTHSPKIIHTQPRDFMALVQKLTGLSRSSLDDDPKPPPPAEGAANSGDGDDAEAKSSKAAAGGGGSGDDNECSSVITEENCSGSVGDGQVNSCFAAAAAGFEASNGGGNPYLSNLPFLPNNVADFLCSNQPNFYDFNEASVLGFHGNTMRTNYMSYSSFREF